MAVRYRAWKQPSVLLVIGFLLAISAVIGLAIGAFLGFAEGLGRQAFWVALALLFAFEAFWYLHRRRRRPTSG